jgi:uncharacterized membrane protein
MDVLGVLLRWLHLLGAAILVGGAFYATLVLGPAMAGMNADARLRLTAGIAARLRTAGFGAIALLVVTGVINIVRNIAGKPPAYHMALTLKLLLALHIFAVLFLVAVPPGNPARDAKRHRLMAGAAVSGLLVLLLSAYLVQGF